MAGSYTRPVQGKFQRYDQGIDYQGRPGDSVVAIGLARVDAVKDDPGGFGKAVYYTLLDGPAKGRQVYVGHASPAVHVNQIVQAGDPVATLLQHPLGSATQPGWVEIGFAKNGVPEGRQTARSFAALLKNTRDQPAQPMASPAAAPVLGTGPAAAVSLPMPTYQPQFGPPIEQTQPTVAPPGSGPDSGWLSQTWQQIAAQPGSSSDTQSYAQNAQLLGG